MRPSTRRLRCWFLVLSLGPVVSGAWAATVLLSPYTPGGFDPPPRVCAFNSFVNAAHVLSLGLVRSGAIRCGNALELDLSSHMERRTLRLLPVHALGTTVCALVVLVAFSVSWPRSVRILSAILLATLALAWGAYLASGVSPSGFWDVPCLVLAWSSVSVGPLCALVLASSGARSLLSRTRLKTGVGRPTRP
jgi:hypothetical protein